MGTVEGLASDIPSDRFTGIINVGTPRPVSSLSSPVTYWNSSFIRFSVESQSITMKS